MNIREQRKRLGVSTRTVQNWEQGGVVPATSKDAITRVLGGEEEKRGWDAVLSRLDRIVELLEVLTGKEVGDGTR